MKETYPLLSLPRRRRLQTMQHTLHHGIVRARLRDLCPVDRRGSAAVGTTNKCERTFVIAGAACASTMYSTDILSVSSPELQESSSYWGEGPQSHKLSVLSHYK